MTDRLPDGRFLPGRSGNPAGRPKSESAQLRTALAVHGEAIAKVVIDAALAGDLQAAKLVLDRISPPLKAQAALVQMDTPLPENVTDAAVMFIRAAADGDIPPDIAAQLVSAVGTLARVIEIDELKHRLEALERATSVIDR